MPTKNTKITLDWEAGSHFEMSLKSKDAGKQIVIRAEDSEGDGCIAVTWADIASACKRCFNDIIDKAGKEIVG